MKLDKDTILLIDDDQLSNALNEHLVASTKIFKNIIVKNGPVDAFRYIVNKVLTDKIIPGYIIIDIDMPDIDGFEFIDLLAELFEENNINFTPIYIILSSSNYIRDFELAEKTPSIKKMISKPLNSEKLISLFNEI